MSPALILLLSMDRSLVPLVSAKRSSSSSSSSSSLFYLHSIISSIHFHHYWLFDFFFLIIILYYWIVDLINPICFLSCSFQSDFYVFYPILIRSQLSYIICVDFACSHQISLTILLNHFLQSHCNFNLYFLLPASDFFSFYHQFWLDQNSELSYKICSLFACSKSNFIFILCNYWSTFRFTRLVLYGRDSSFSFVDY